MARAVTLALALALVGWPAAAGAGGYGDALKGLLDAATYGTHGGNGTSGVRICPPRIIPLQLELALESLADDQRAALGFHLDAAFVAAPRAARRWLSFVGLGFDASVGALWQGGLTGTRYALGPMVRLGAIRGADPGALRIRLDLALLWISTEGVTGPGATRTGVRASLGAAWPFEWSRRAGPGKYEIDARVGRRLLAGLVPTAIELVVVAERGVMVGGSLGYAF